jgi:enamine deaminase RidA (YjgF/YER057c/UK114 family)
VKHVGLRAPVGDDYKEGSMSVESRLAELGLELPPAPSPAGNYVPTVRVGNLLYVAGTLALKDGEISHRGQVGKEQTVESGYEAAKICALNTLAALKAGAGDLEKVKRIVLVNGFVNAVPNFAQSPQVLNGASDLFVAVLGDKGKHARAAVAVAGLPRESAVEIQVVAEVE